MKLCLVKVGKSDACIRPLFANSVTYGLAITGITKVVSYIDIVCITHIAIATNVTLHFFCAQKAMDHINDLFSLVFCLMGQHTLE